MATDNLTPRTIEIPLTKGYIAIVDEQDADLACHKWRTLITHGRVYAQRYAPFDKTVFMHREIYVRMTDRQLVRSDKIDHIDNYPLNNTRLNLRIATSSQNGSNAKRQSNNTTGYKGVYLCENGNSWVARITIHKKTIGLGTFNNPIDAFEAYKAAAIKYFGEFARFE